jgi:hypothetical protein
LIRKSVWTRNLKAKLLALVLAIGLWFSVTNRIEFEQEIDFPIQYVDWPEGLTSVEPLPQTVRARVTGKGKFLRYWLRDGVCRIDLSSYQIGLNNFVVSPENLRLPPDVQVSHKEILRPRRIEAEFDTAVVRDIPISAWVTGEPADNYVRVGKVFVSPTVARVKGPRKLVDQIGLLSTEEIDIKGDRRTVRRQVPVSRPFPSTVEISPSLVEIGITIEPILERSIEGVALDTAGQIHEDWDSHFFPPSITVSISGAHSLVEVSESQVTSLLLSTAKWSLGTSRLVVKEIRDRKIVFVPRDSLPFVTLPSRADAGNGRTRTNVDWAEQVAGPLPKEKIPPCVTGEVVGGLPLPPDVKILDVKPREVVLWISKAPPPESLAQRAEGSR